MTHNRSGSRLDFLLAEDVRNDELQNLAKSIIARLLTEAKPVNETETAQVLIALVSFAVAIAQTKCDTDSLICYLTGMLFILRGQQIIDGPTGLQ
jgi:hypothetical protein